MIATVIVNLKYTLRYKFSLLNRIFSTYFILAPYVYIAGSMDLAIPILKNMIAWYWFNQFMFAIGGSLAIERMEGTFVNILCYPISVVKYLFAKSIPLMMECLLVTLITLTFFYASGYQMEQIGLFLLALVIRSGNLFCFSLLFCSLTLRYKRIYALNSILQQLLGIASGYTSDIMKFPYYIRFFSYLIPFTYTILALRMIPPVFHTAYLLPESLLSCCYLAAGMYLINRNIKRMKQNGEFEQW